MNNIYSFYTDKELVSLALNAARTPLELELTKRLEALLPKPLSELYDTYEEDLAKKAGS
jgi:hypothetical protein